MKERELNNGFSGPGKKRSAQEIEEQIKFFKNHDVEKSFNNDLNCAISLLMLILRNQSVRDVILEKLENDRRDIIKLAEKDLADLKVEQDD